MNETAQAVEPTDQTATPAANLEVHTLSERTIALALVMEFAEQNTTSFSLLGFYDDDLAFLEGLADRLRVRNDRAFVDKLRRIVRRLTNYGVLIGEMKGTSKEYVGEPAKQMNYWLKPGKAELIRKGKTDYTMAPEDEAAFLLRHAYPADEAQPT